MKAELRKLVEAWRNQAALYELYPCERTSREDYSACANELESILAREDEPERVARERLETASRELLRNVCGSTNVPSGWLEVPAGDVHALRDALDAAERSRT